MANTTTYDSSGIFFCDNSTTKKGIDFLPCPNKFTLYQNGTTLTPGGTPSQKYNNTIAFNGRNICISSRYYSATGSNASTAVQYLAFSEAKYAGESSRVELGQGSSYLRFGDGIKLNYPTDNLSIFLYNSGLQGEIEVTAGDTQGENAVQHFSKSCFSYWHFTENRIQDILFSLAGSRASIYALSESVSSGFVLDPNSETSFMAQAPKMRLCAYGISDNKAIEKASLTLDECGAALVSKKNVSVSAVSKIDMLATCVVALNGSNVSIVGRTRVRASAGSSESSANIVLCNNVALVGADRSVNLKVTSSDVSMHTEGNSKVNSLSLSKEGLLSAEASNITLATIPVGSTVNALSMTPDSFTLTSKTGPANIGAVISGDKGKLELAAKSNATTYGSITIPASECLNMVVQARCVSIRSSYSDSSSHLNVNEADISARAGSFGFDLVDTDTGACKNALYMLPCKTELTNRAHTITSKNCDGSVTTIFACGNEISLDANSGSRLQMCTDAMSIHSNRLGIDGNINMAGPVSITHQSTSGNTTPPLSIEPGKIRYRNADSDVWTELDLSTLGSGSSGGGLSGESIEWHGTGLLSMEADQSALIKSTGPVNVCSGSTLTLSTGDTGSIIVDSNTIKGTGVLTINAADNSSIALKGRYIGMGCMNSTTSLVGSVVQIANRPGMGQFLMQDNAIDMVSTANISMHSARISIVSSDLQAGCLSIVEDSTSKSVKLSTDQSEVQFLDPVHIVPAGATIPPLTIEPGKIRYRNTSSDAWTELDLSTLGSGGGGLSGESIDWHGTGTLSLNADTDARLKSSSCVSICSGGLLWLGASMTRMRGVNELKLNVGSGNDGLNMRPECLSLQTGDAVNSISFNKTDNTITIFASKMVTLGTSDCGVSIEGTRFTSGGVRFTKPSTISSTNKLLLDLGCSLELSNKAGFPVIVTSNSTAVPALRLSPGNIEYYKKSDKTYAVFDFEQISSEVTALKEGGSGGGLSGNSLEWAGSGCLNLKPTTAASISAANGPATLSGCTLTLQGGKTSIRMAKCALELTGSELKITSATKACITSNELSWASSTASYLHGDDYGIEIGSPEFKLCSNASTYIHGYNTGVENSIDIYAGDSVSLHGSAAAVTGNSVRTYSSTNTDLCSNGSLSLNAGNKIELRTPQDIYMKAKNMLAEFTAMQVLSTKLCLNAACANMTAGSRIRLQAPNVYVCSSTVLDIKGEGGVNITATCAGGLKMRSAKSACINAVHIYLAATDVNVLDPLYVDMTRHSYAPPLYLTPGLIRYRNNAADSWTCLDLSTLSSGGGLSGESLAWAGSGCLNLKPAAGFVIGTSSGNGNLCANSYLYLHGSSGIEALDAVTIYGRLGLNTGVAPLSLQPGEIRYRTNETQQWSYFDLESFRLKECSAGETLTIQATKQPNITYLNPVTVSVSLGSNVAPLSLQPGKIKYRANATEQWSEIDLATLASGSNPATAAAWECIQACVSVPSYMKPLTYIVGSTEKIREKLPTGLCVCPNMPVGSTGKVILFKDAIGGTLDVSSVFDTTKAVISSCLDSMEGCRTAVLTWTVIPKVSDPTVHKLFVSLDGVCYQREVS